MVKRLVESSLNEMIILSDDNILIKKINDFIRKYYKNRIIKGSFITVGALAGSFLSLVILEYYFYLNPFAKTILFFSYFIFAAFLFTKKILIPAFQFLEIGKHLTPKQAAGIIGNHFKDIEDKLLNTLQLIELNLDDSKETSLLKASIIQRTNQLKIFEFNQIINIRNTIKIFKYSLLPLLFIILLLLFTPSTISDPTSRIINFQKQYNKPLPFNINILNKNLVAIQQQDFELNLKADGAEVPLDIYVNYDGVDYKMKRNKNSIFSYTFKTIQNSVDFYIKTDSYLYDRYTIRVFPKPVILAFNLKITFPPYLNKPEEINENQGDCNIPEGSQLTWKIFTKDVSRIVWRDDYLNLNLKSEKDQSFSHKIIAKRSFTYSLTPYNDHSYQTDSLQYHIIVIPDGFPTIFLNFQPNPTDSNLLSFNGTIKDDYGFSNLFFKYYFINDSISKKANTKNLNVAFNKETNDQVFTYLIDFDTLNIPKNTELVYYFEVYDNDGIHGPKSAKSEERRYKRKSEEQINSEVRNEEKIRDQLLMNGIKETKNVRKNMEELQKRWVDQKALNWQEKKQLERLLEQSEELTKRIDEIDLKSKMILESESKNFRINERILQKQKQIYELYQQILNEDMKKQVEEIKKIIENVNKERIIDLIEKLKNTNKNIEEELDRNLSLLKQLEFEKRLDELIRDLKKESESIMKLADEAKQRNPNITEMINKLNEITDSTHKLFKRLEQIESDNRLTETPIDLKNTNDQRDSIRKELGEAIKELSRGDKEKASKTQRYAGESIKKLADQLESAMNDSELEQEGEDARTIRILLENLIRLSFEQEELISQTKIISRVDPKYLENLNKQKNFASRLQIIEDSLRAIGRRQVMVRPVLNKELFTLKENIEMATEDLESRNINMAMVKQQYIMTALNNLAVLIKEALDKMEEQMSQSMSSKAGSKSCKNPGKNNGKRNAKNIRELQNNLGKQLENLKASMENAKNKSNSGINENEGISKELAELAARQEIIRMELQKLKDGSAGLSKEEKEVLNSALNEMEKLEKELITKTMNKNTLERQQKILSRLLESEKAEFLREKDEKRTAEEAKNSKISNPNEKFKYNKKNRTGNNETHLQLPELKLFYKNKVNSYIVKIEQNYE